MRTKKALKNSIYSIFSYALLVVVGFLSRKLFLKYLSLDYLGYDSLFANVFALLSLAELGVGTAVIYRLYVAVSNKDEEETALLMQLYKLLYMIIGGVVLVMGIVLSFFIPVMIKDPGDSIGFLRTIYFLQLASTVSTYFLAYKRALFKAEQREFELIKVDTAVNTVTKIVKLIIIAVFKNYILYLSAEIFGVMLANIIIGHKYNREYGKMEKPKVSREDFKKRNFFADVKNILATQIALTVHGGTDSIIISSMFGAKSVGLVSNYLFITGNVGNVIRKACEPLTASIASLVHSEDKKTARQAFDMFQLVGFFMASFVTVSFFILMHPFITLFFGGEYVISQAYIVALCADAYIGWNAYFVSIFRNVLGHFELDRNYAIMAAISNLVLSIVLGLKIGLAGIALGTFISQFFFWVGRLRVVFSEGLATGPRKYVLTQLFRLTVFVAELALSVYLASIFNSFIYKMCVCALVPNLLNILIFYRTEEFKLLTVYFQRIKSLLFRKKGE